MRHGAGNMTTSVATRNSASADKTFLIKTRWASRRRQPNAEGSQVVNCLHFFLELILSAYDITWHNYAIYCQ
jgi:hypothetical protein